MRQQSDNISLETGRIRENKISAQSPHQMEPIQSWLKEKNVKNEQLVSVGLNWTTLSPAETYLIRQQPQQNLTHNLV